MKNLWTIVACIAAASAAGIITEWSVAKDAGQVVAQSAEACLPHINSVPYHLRLLARPEQEI